ncbi:peptide-methionine (R)-S-oxide reductase MsrB [Halodesulfovibrio spirochaetisodalis]|uniref:peptide-methionine (R)-S-oxide reductase n=1 Tax=Halodesulfovibrio spirochaetisodalis TaxID=1560234 RepID=A0A1B7XBL3_9BACT|nr:peptide-methionine (R)-S-oxide reductase MsrB [Halodesulfovibrio spirochaetisodalis]OBQ46690.1 methionine sulfoxide reductase B [Halodesulfovibrio spirochaetisodalis]
MNQLSIVTLVGVVCSVLCFASGAALAAPWDDYKKPDDAKMRELLTPVQYRITQEDGTEPSFKNEYYKNYDNQGVYVDLLSGAPLFSTTDQYDSGSGWPAFTKPIDPKYITLIKKFSFFGEVYEVRSKTSDSHLGDRFTDGPPPEHLRYCINSAALRFIPKNEMKEKGYGAYLELFK